jgi:MPBQ/MSBQ methyltransferase
MADVADLVRGHYGGAGLEDAILRALRDAGMDADTLTAEQLAPVDQLHMGGAPATRHLLDQLALDTGSRLLDVGCGIGGPARLAAELVGCRVVGIDLAPDFIDVARRLTARLGLSELVEHRVSAGEVLDLEDGSFDAAMMIHVGMNIPDKAAVFAEVRRVLRAGGAFGLFEQMRTGTGAPTYPLPWAEDERSSFVATPEEYTDALETTGFAVEQVDNRTAGVIPAGGGAPRLSPATVFGPPFTERLAHNVQAARAGIIQPVLIVARAR